VRAFSGSHKSLAAGFLGFGSALSSDSALRFDSALGFDSAIGLSLDTDSGSIFFDLVVGLGVTLVDLGVLGVLGVYSGEVFLVGARTRPERRTDTTSLGASMVDSSLKVLALARLSPPGLYAASG
jgi:hypothetical protein